MKKNGNGKNQKNFINSENLRGRRPVDLPPGLDTTFS